MSIICPACHTELHPSNTSCPVCLRDRTPQEIVRGLQEIKREEGRRRRSPFYLALFVSGLGAGAYLLYSGKVRLPLPASTAPPPAPGPAEPPAPPARESPSARPAAPPLDSPQPQEPPLLPPPTALPETAPPVAAPPDYPGTGLWRIFGRAYDLVTLDPVASARVTFTDKRTGRRRSTRTNGKGRYSVLLPPLGEGGYVVEVSHPGHRSVFLDEADPPYHRQSRARREEAGYQLGSSEILHVPILLENDFELEHNLILLPRE